MAAASQNNHHSITKYVRSSDNSSVLVTVVSPTSNANLYFGLIIQDIGVNWVYLAMTLGITYQDIQVMKQNNITSVHEQCMDMLNSHYRSKGNSFTKLRLVEALYSSGLRAAAEKINHLDLSGSVDVLDASTVKDNTSNPGQQVNKYQVNNNALNPQRQINKHQDISRHFYDVAHNLQSDWIKLAAKLDTSEKINVRMIEDANDDDFDRADVFLCQWEKVYHDSATIRRLISALRAIDRGDIAAMIDSNNANNTSQAAASIANNPGPANIELDNAIHQHASNILEDDSMRNKYFTAIAEQINWDQLDKLGRKLTLQSNVVNEVISTNRDIFSKCFRLLDLWYQKFANNAELEYLLTVLKECGREDICKKLQIIQ